MEVNRREIDFTDYRKSREEIQRSQLPILTGIQCHAREVMTLALLCSDAISLLLAYSAALGLRVLIFGDLPFLLNWNLLFILMFFLAVYAIYGLYPGVGLSPVREIKQVVSGTNIVYLMLIALTFLEKTTTNYSRFMLGTAWLLSLALVQLDRWLTRIVGRNLGYWGEPVAVVGNGPEGKRIVQYLNDRIRLGMNPVLVIDGHAPYDETPLTVINSSQIRTVILVTPETSIANQKRFIDDQRYGFYRRRGEKSIAQVILISSLGWVGSMGVTPLDLEGFLGLQIPQNLLNIWSNILKRTIDLLLTAVFVLFSSPFLLLIAALICLDSRGGIFYRQKRVGHKGKIFKMWKFRTMKENADQVLKSYLDSNPSMKKEWEVTQKLKNDPRVTRVGRFLRKFSLDEIPQLINVVRGEMSVVGPRPYFPEQEELYGDGNQLYKRVHPGMTGMWQVRGRNTKTFKERARLDEYYIRNWSVWLDIYILLRTVLVVFSNEGAY